MTFLVLLFSLTISQTWCQIAFRICASAHKAGHKVPMRLLFASDTHKTHPHHHHRSATTVQQPIHCSQPQLYGFYVFTSTCRPHKHYYPYNHGDDDGRQFCALHSFRQISRAPTLLREAEGLEMRRMRPVVCLCVFFCCTRVNVHPGEHAAFYDQNNNMHSVCVNM